MLNVLVARPVPRLEEWRRPRVSVIVPARNESGNIEQAVLRRPEYGTRRRDYLRGGGLDRQHLGAHPESAARHAYQPANRQSRIRTVREGRRGAQGLSTRANEILMILDADLTVPPEDLPKFYDAIVSGKGRVYQWKPSRVPDGAGAMRFLNLLANKFFAVASRSSRAAVQGHPVRHEGHCADNYERMAAHRRYFGDFDPFGDFDLIFGASR